MSAVLFSVLFLTVFLEFVVGQYGASVGNPCPRIFQYKRQPNGLNYGEVEFPNDGSGNFVLEVNVTVVGKYENANIKLELKTPYEDLYSGKSATYRVHFPVQNVLPTLNLIKFNGRPVCVGVRENVVTLRGITMMWARSILNLNVNGIAVPNYSTLGNSGNSVTSGSSGGPSVSGAIVADVEERGQDQRQCGIANDVQTLVVNGAKTRQHEFPWLVAIMWKNDHQYDFKCTGNLISDVHVITAAHCLQFYRALLMPKEDLLVVLGKHDLDKWANSGAILRDVKEVDVHPLYKQHTAEGDLAIITMDSPVSFTNKISPVCIWDESALLEPLVKTSGTTAGWGKDETGKEFVDEPRKVSMPIVSQESCLRSHPAYFEITSENTFCAGGLDGRGPCSGDSGSGFILNRNGRWVLRGVVSFAVKDVVGSCDASKYFVFADVAKLKGWVLGVMSNRAP